MAVSFLDFEQPIAELEAKIEELGHLTPDSKVNIAEEVARLQKKSRQLTSTIFASLTPWQITQIARHPRRPYTLDYIQMICTDFTFGYSIAFRASGIFEPITRTPIVVNETGST